MGGLCSMRLPLLWTVRIRLLREEAISALPILAVPEGQVHFLQLTIDLHDYDMDVLAAA